MKKVVFFIMLMFIPILLAYSQDDKTVNKQLKPVRIIQKEIVCPDCQGFGWIYSVNSPLFQIRKMSSFQTSSKDNATINNFYRTYRMICPYCGGKKTVFVEYKLY